MWQDYLDCIPITLVRENIGTAQYGSVWNVDRLRNLANARQKCLELTYLFKFDKIAYIEPDVSYDPNWCKELILARHPISTGLGEPDVYSGWSLRSDAHPKESQFLYDTCATRATEDDLTWDITENFGKWRGESLIKTDLGGVDSNCLHKVWSTFNCFCVYNAKPFIDGLKWDYINRRLDTGQQYIDAGPGALSLGGFLDADTSVMCELFREGGYDKIFLNTNCLVRHS